MKRSWPVRWGDVGAEVPVEIRDAAGSLLDGDDLGSAALRVEAGSEVVELELTAPGGSETFPEFWTHAWTAEDFESLPNATAKYVAQVFAVRTGETESRTVPTVGDLELRVGRKI